jgi:hypothetical protein
MCSYNTHRYVIIPTSANELQRKKEKKTSRYQTFQNHDCFLEIKISILQNNIHGCANNAK